MEAVIGAIYLDGGWKSASKFVEENWTELAKAETEAPKDPKTALQELAQIGDGKLPEYEFLDEKKNKFRARVTALGESAEGSAGTKKGATIAAAQNLLEQLKK
jgi:ribonuclease-3